MKARTTVPTKEQVRHYMEQQLKRHLPPPSPEEIRRQLGWKLVAH
jgi:hypothetical protein